MSFEVISGGLDGGDGPKGSTSSARPLGAAADRLQQTMDHFVATKRAQNVSPRTIDFYREQLLPFMGWLRENYPAVRRIEDLTVEHRRGYLGMRQALLKPDGTPHLQPESLDAFHRAATALFNWAEADGYEIDRRLQREKGPKVPPKEMTVFTVDQVEAMIPACKSPTERMAIRLLAGTGFRRGEARLFRAVSSSGQRLIESRLWDGDRTEFVVQDGPEGGAKGQKGRRVPVCPTLAAHARRYLARERRESAAPEFLLNRFGQPYGAGGLDSLMDRLEHRLGFRIYCHAFRHTWATAITQVGWNLEYLRAWAGHEDYETLHGYIKLATKRDLGPKDRWAKWIVVP